MSTQNSNPKFVFFGTSDVSVGTLEVLKENGLTPSLVVTDEDKAKGRGMQKSPPPSKIWAEIHHVPYIQPSSLRDKAVRELLSKEDASFFLVVDYGKMLPRDIFELPDHKTLNIHYSRLPSWRGASPIHATILHEDEAWVSITEIVEKLDSGPILAQKKLEVPEWPPRFDVLRDLMIRESTELLVGILPDWIEGRLRVTTQDDNEATYCTKIQKAEGLLDLFQSPQENLRKVRAFYLWPGSYFFFKSKNGKSIRIIVKEAEIQQGEFTPLTIVPEGRKEMLWEDFLRGHKEL